MTTNLFALLTRHRLLLLVAVCVAGLMLPVFLGGRAGLGLLARMPPGHFAVLVLLMILTWHLNLLRWYLLISDRPSALTYRYAIRAYLALDFFTKTLPAGTGAPLAAVYYLRPFGVPLHRALALLAVEALLAVLTLLAAVAVLILVSSGEGIGVRWALGGLLPVIGLLLALLWVVFRHHQRVLRILAGTMRVCGVSGHWRRRICRALLKLHRALLDMGQLERWKLMVCAMTGVLMWLLYLSVMCLVASALDASLDWADAGLIQAVAMGLGHLLMVPGAAIGSEAAGAVLLTPQLGPALAASVILYWRFLTFYLNVAVGALCALSLARDARFAPRAEPTSN